jgi:hypothetical protein
MDPARMLAGFPAPWSVSEATGEFVVKDANGRALAYFYWWGDTTTALLTRDEARCLAEKFRQGTECYGTAAQRGRLRSAILDWFHPASRFNTHTRETCIACQTPLPAGVGTRRS